MLLTCGWVLTICAICVRTERKGVLLYVYIHGICIYVLTPFTNGIRIITIPLLPFHRPPTAPHRPTVLP